MNTEIKQIYDKIYGNAVMFLRRAIKELINKQGDVLEREQAVVSCIFIQMAVELGLKAYLIKTKSLESILQGRHKNQFPQDLYRSFESGDLKTKTFEELKRIIVAEGQLFDQTQIDYINQFQRYRNQAVHFNLKLESSDLYDLKYELIYVLVRVIIPILTEINMDFESPSEFYQNNLDKEDYKTLVKYRPYVEEMQKVAAKHAFLVYDCIECGERTYSVDNEMCYCCNLQFADFGEYITCTACKAPRSLIFDHLNIKSNNNIMSGLCLNCQERPQVFKCPDCGIAFPFYAKSELEGTCYSKCEM